MRFVCLWVVAVALGAQCYKCPNPCFCYTWRGLVRTDCVRRNLINTFLGFSYRTQVLDLSHNSISTLHGNEFLDANLRQLQDLRLSNNEIQKIDRFSFNGLHYLKNLDLSRNSIEYLNPSTFWYNPNLETLNVSFNPLVLTKEGPFLFPAPSLQLLDLANCRLDSVSPCMFSDLTSLRVLNISANNIGRIQFPERMDNLRFLDVSRNDLPCDDQTNALLQSLIKRRIQFRAFCETSERMQMFPATEGIRLDFYDGNYENVTQEDTQRRSLYNDVMQFFQSIPTLYAIVCGVHVGIFIGSFSTYICLKKSNGGHRKYEDEDEDGSVEETQRNEKSDNLSLVLIPLNTPPGTPPSPYHSRFFPSNFSLSAT